MAGFEGLGHAHGMLKGGIRGVDERWEKVERSIWSMPSLAVQSSYEAVVVVKDGANIETV